MKFIQGTWVYNFPYAVNDEMYHMLGPFDHLLKYLKLVGEKVIFLNTDHGKFIEPQIFEKVKNKKQIIDDINKIGAVFVMYEPLCLYSNSGNHLLVSFYHELSHTVTDIKSREIDDILDLCKKYGIDNFEIRACDYDHTSILTKSYPGVKILYDDIFIKSAKIRESSKYSSLNNRFICINARYSPHRNLVMSYLVDKNGLYSWPFTVSTNVVDSITWIARKNINYPDIVKRNKLLNQQEFNVDFFPYEKSNVESLKWFYAARNVNYDVNITASYYSDCFCAIVTETRYAQPFSNFSEKTLKPICYRIPFVLVAPPYTLVALKSLGYKTFDKWWDESYDLEEDHTLRMQKIFKVIDFINSLSDHQITEMYSEMKDTLDHNATLLSNN
jgi:hypothetical protein